MIDSDISLEGPTFNTQFHTHRNHETEEELTKHVGIQDGNKRVPFDYIQEMSKACANE